jgi:3-deoxy-7-phosphoheptulonate synthase
MRCYFEKPRTTVGWKGLINDPFIDGSFQINVGLRKARQLLADMCEIGFATGTEFLDTSVPQHIADLIAWGAIGARTSESQTHRELASGLSMPVGFKNATDGNVQIAIDAIQAAGHPHWFPGTTKDGLNAIIQTTGNNACHVILRGGTHTGPNYTDTHIQHTAELLGQSGLPQRLMVDFSHGNSGKDHLRQLEVAQDVAKQLRSGQSIIFGVMIESFLKEGRQNYGPNPTYGQSITDACLSIEQTMQALEILAEANLRRV